MSTRRRLFIATLTLTLVTSGVADVRACWLTDWLHGNSAPVYMAGPTTGGATQVAGAGSAGGAYAAGYAPVVTSSYAARYAPAVRGGAAALPLATRQRSGADYSLQRPTYLDNPSVYTGEPTLQSSRRISVGSPAYASGSVPISGSLRGSAATSSSFYGTGNIYPDTAAAGNVPTSAYASARPGISTAASGNTTTTLYAAPPRRRGGLARFFGSLLGTDYRSSYYRAPVTYYRPATTVDPVTGSAVTVQRPCTSTIQQLQRTPYRSLQHPSPAPSATPAPSAGCRGGTNQPLSSYGSAGGSPSALSAPSSGVSPASGYGNDGRVAPIPSTGETYPAPNSGSRNTAPLTGPPPAAGDGTHDRAPVEQPQLNSSRPPSASFRRETTEPSDSLRDAQSNDDANGQSYRRSTEANASEAPASQRNGNGNSNSNSNSSNGNSFRYHRQPARGDDSMAAHTPPSLSEQSRQVDHRSVRPIPAPSGYRSPFQSGHDASSQPARPSTEPDRGRAPLDAPPLPAVQPRESAQPAYQRSPDRISVPVREAALERPAADSPPGRHDGAKRTTWRDRQPDAPADDWRAARGANPQRQPAARPRVTTDSSAWYSLDP